MKLSRSALLVMLLPLATSSTGWANADPNWDAQFIGWPGEDAAVGAQREPHDRPNQWICFRKQLKLTDVPHQLTWRVACDSKYWLWVNGQLLVREGQLKRGPDPTGTYFDQFELTDSLQTGNNNIAVLVWFFGKDGFAHKNSGRAGLLLQVDASADATPVLVSDDSWHVKRHPAFFETDEPRPNYRLAESNPRFDSRQDIPDWTTTDFDDTDWPQAVSYGRPPVEPWNHLVRRPIPRWMEHEPRSYANHGELPSQGPGLDHAIVAKLPHAAQVWPRLTIQAPAGQEIDIRTDQYRGGGEESVRVEYVTREGEQSFESPAWISGEEVHYRIPTGVRILDLSYRETGFDTQFAGSFSCDDPQLESLWRKARRSLYLCMRDSYMDCPDRERAQWWGDVVICLGQSFYSLDRQSDRLTRKAILDLANWQKPSGELFSPVPAGNWDKELPLQMLASVGRYGIWNYYLHSGDRETLAVAYPHVRDYLSLWKLDERGLVEQRTGGWTWGDWGNEKDLPVLYNGWYYLALDGLRQMASALGYEADATAAEDKQLLIRGQFDEQFWNGAAYRSADHQGRTDDRAQALAVVSGLCSPDKYAAVRKVLREEEHASPYMERFVLEALFQMGAADEAMARMKRRYAEMIESPRTTLWENWNAGKPGGGGATFNHAWSGGPLTLLSQFVAGVAPLKPGYHEVEITPQLGPLARASVVVPSVRGPITADIQRTETRYTLQLELPETVTAIVAIPNQRVHSVIVNDRQVWPVADDANAASNSSVQFTNATATRLRFHCVPGRYHFAAAFD